MGVKKMLTPNSLAPIIFSAIPPIGPTFPVVVIVPVPAIFRDRIKSSTVNLSTTPIAKIKPPLGPPVSSNLIFTSNGKTNCS